MTPADLSALIAGSNGAIIDGGGQTVTFATKFTFFADADLRNFKFAFPFDGVGMNPRSVVGAACAPNSGLPRGFVQIAFDTVPGFIADDMLFMKSDDPWANTTEIVSQWVRVKSVSPDGLTITLYAPLDYTFLSNIRLYKTEIKTVKYTSCKFTGLGAANAQKLLQPESCAVTLQNCEFEKTGMACVELSNCYGVFAANNSFKFAKNASQAYGMSFLNGCENILVTNSSGEDLIHLFTFGGVGGINRHGLVTNSNLIGARKAIVDTHASADMITFLGVTGSVAPDAISELIMMQGARCKVLGVNVTNSKGCISYQPMTRLENDWCELDGVLVDFNPSTDQPAFFFENLKPAGSILYVKLSGGGNGPRALVARSNVAAEIKMLQVDLNFVSSMMSAYIFAGASGKFHNIDMRGFYERTNQTAENILFHATLPGGIGDAVFSGKSVGGTYSLRNINSTRVRAMDGSQLMGSSIAKTLGPVSMAVT